MLCDECKVKPATVHLTQVYDGKKIESHLCDQCARQKSEFLFDSGNNFSIPNLLGGIFGAIYNAPDAPDQNNKCPNCGMSFYDFKRLGMLGCSQCYNLYGQELEASLRRIHGNSRHIGKIPIRSGGNVLIKRQIEDLKNQIQDAVREEKYEQAAQIRDQLIELEKELS